MFSPVNMFSPIKPSTSTNSGSSSSSSSSGASSPNLPSPTPESSNIYLHMRWAANAPHAKHVRLSMETLAASQRIIADIPRDCTPNQSLNFKMTYNSKYVDRVTVLPVLTCSLSEVRGIKLFVVSQPSTSSDPLTETTIVMEKLPELAPEDHLYVNIVAVEDTFHAIYEVHSGIEQPPLSVVQPQAAVAQAEGTAVSNLLTALANLETVSTQFRNSVFGSHTAPRPSPEEQDAITQQLLHTKKTIEEALLALSSM